MEYKGNNDRPVKCPHCEKTFRRSEGAFVEYKSRFYHQDCYDEMMEISKDERALDEYIKKLFNSSFVPPRIQNQKKQYVKNYNYTYSGIHGSLFYFYEVLGNGNISKYGDTIGIVPNVYEEAKRFFNDLERMKLLNEGKSKESEEVMKVKMKRPKRKPKTKIQIIDFE